MHIARAATISAESHAIIRSLCAMVRILDSPRAVRAQPRGGLAYDFIGLRSSTPA